jgi:hypothetical protein
MCLTETSICLAGRCWGTSCNPYQPMPSAEEYLKQEILQLPKLRAQYLDMGKGFLEEYDVMAPRAEAAGIGVPLLAPPSYSSGRAACACFGGSTNSAVALQILIVSARLIWTWTWSQTCITLCLGASP